MSADLTFCDHKEKRRYLAISKKTTNNDAARGQDLTLHSQDADDLTEYFETHDEVCVNFQNPI